MKVLLLSTGARIGGEETFTRNLALALQKRGIDVRVCPGGPVQKEDLQKNGIDICEEDITGRSPLGLLKGAKTITKYVIDNGIDVVHSQAVGPAIMGVIAKKFYSSNVPWLWTNHGITDFAYNHIVKHLNSLDLVISNSDYVYVMLKNHGVHESRLKRIHNGINVSDFSVTKEEQKLYREMVEKEFGIKPDKKIVTYVGRLSPEKGVNVLLEAFQGLHNEKQDTVCLLIGDGVERKKYEEFVANTNCKDSYIFAGFRKDIKELLSASDILVLPSLIETFSLTTLQAFVAGATVVASDVGGTPEQVLPDFNGLLFKSLNVEDLKNKLVFVLENPDKAVSYKKHARELCENYLNEDRMTDEIVSAYTELIKKQNK